MFSPIGREAATVLMLALLSGARGQHPECHAIAAGVIAMSGCTGDCSDCHVDAVNTVLCPNTNDCCTIDGIEQAVGNSNVGETVPTICTDSAQEPDTECVDSNGDNKPEGSACLHFGHPGSCDGSGQCVDANPCSEAKKTQIAACAADCTACTSDHIDVLLGSCTVNGVLQAYGDTFCGSGKCIGNANAADDVVCAAGNTYDADAWSIIYAQDDDCCVNCPAGTYRTGDDDVDCSYCDAGRYVEATGSDEASDCIGCSAGRWSHMHGSPYSTDCIACVAGRYSTTVAATRSNMCIACEAGRTVETTGNDEESDCVAIDADPTDADSNDADPTAADPTAADPTDADPTAADPTAADPTAADPTAADPTAADPTAADPTDDNDGPPNAPAPVANAATSATVRLAAIVTAAVGAAVLF